MRFCKQPAITDAAFAHLRGIHTLDMSGCKQAGITDAAFAHLRGIHTLDMSFCNQPGITDAAFAHLCGVRELSMRGCNGVAAAFELGLPVDEDYRAECLQWMRNEDYSEVYFSEDSSDS